MAMLAFLFLPALVRARRRAAEQPGLRPARAKACVVPLAALPKAGEFEEEPDVESGLSSKAEPDGEPGPLSDALLDLDLEGGFPTRCAASMPQLCRRSTRRVSFNERVSVVHVKDLKGEPVERKGSLWCQQSDYDKFLQDRVAAGKAYRAAAKKKGLDITQVTHSSDSYAALLEVNPQLKDESLWGLGLGRKRGLAKRSRDAYIGAVLREQERQTRAQGVLLNLDAEAIAAAARRAANNVAEFAHKQALLFFEMDCREASDGEPEPMRSPTLPALPSYPSLAGLCEGDEDPSPDEIECCTLNDELPATPSGGSRSASKGFGVSKEKLMEVGLSVTGSCISRYTRLRQLKPISRDDSDGSPDGESDQGTSGETDEDGLCISSENAEILAEYRIWRMGASVRAGLPGYSDIKTYGTRKEYRTWRAWKPATPLAQASKNRSNSR